MNREVIPGMRRGKILLLVLVLGLGTVRAADFSIGGLVGYKGGAAVRLTGTLSNFAEEFPLALEFGAGLTWMDPGNAAEARRIFINDATNGTPEKSGSQWDLRLDFLYRLKVMGRSRIYAYAGVRRSMFTGNFKFVGGNEDFDVTCNQWGLGLGLKGAFAMGKNFDFTMALGFDQFFGNTLQGHDTSYSPDGETVNGHHEYTYDDADAAINQPKFQPTALIGISYTF